MLTVAPGVHNSDLTVGTTDTGDYYLSDDRPRSASGYEQQIEPGPGCRQVSRGSVICPAAGIREIRMSTGGPAPGEPTGAFGPSNGEVGMVIESSGGSYEDRDGQTHRTHAVPVDVLVRMTATSPGVSVGATGSYVIDTANGGADDLLCYTPPTETTKLDVGVDRVDGQCTVKPTSASPPPSMSTSTSTPPPSGPPPAGPRPGPVGPSPAPPVAATACKTPTITVGDAELLASCWNGTGDVVTATGRVRLNGLDIDPGAGTVSVDKRNRRLTTSTSAKVGLGPLSLARGKLNWSIGKTLAFSIAPGGSDAEEGHSLGELLLKGSVGVTFAGGKLTGTVSAELPPPLSAVTAEIAVAADNQRGLVLDSLKATIDAVEVGPAEVRDASLSYSSDDGGRWEGTATFYPSQVQAFSIQGTLGFGAGGYFKLGGAVDGLNKPLFGGVFFQKAQAELTLNPFSLLGGIGVTYGPQFKLKGEAPISAARLDGTFKYSAGSPASFELAGTGKVVIADFDGKVTATTDGVVDTAGNVSLTIPGFDQYGFTGAITGWYESSAFELDGHAKLSLPGPDAEGEALLSSTGVAACRRGRGPDFGFGYRWDGDLDVFSHSCGLGRFRAQRPGSRSVGATTRQLGPPAPGRFTVAGGQPTVAFAIHGQSGAPHVELTGPGGLSVVTPGDPEQAVDTDKAYAVADPQTDTTYIAVDAPAGGVYTLTAQADSVPVTSYESAGSQPVPSVKATLSPGPRSTRVVRYAARSLAGGTLQLVEEGPGVRQVLATTKRASGRVAFDPDPGPAGRRTVRVIVQQDGIPVGSQVIARFATRRVAVPRPSRLRVIRGQAWLRASWSGPAGASYLVDLALDDGRRVLRRVAVAHTTFAAVPPKAVARVRVQLVSASGRRSARVTVTSRSAAQVTRPHHHKRARGGKGQRPRR